MKILFSTYFFLIVSSLMGQTNPKLSNIIAQVSVQWKNDSSSCAGYRKTVVHDFFKCQIDTVSKNQLFLQMGKPNQIQKFYSGVTNKNYVGYIYYIYKDACPKIILEGYAIQFVFDETETLLLEINQIDYCS